MPPLNEPKHESFARLVASGKSKRDAAIEAGFSQKSASAIGSRLSKAVKVSQRIDELKTQVAEKVVEKTTRLLDLDIASRQSRLSAQQKRWELLEQIRSERAADPTMQGIPGGKTGLLVRQIRSIEITTQDGAKKKQVITEFVVDAVMLKEARAHEQLAAQESGQWQNNDIDQSAAGRGKVYIGTPDGEEEAKPLNADALATAGKGLSVQ